MSANRSLRDARGGHFRAIPAAICLVAALVLASGWVLSLARSRPDPAVWTGMPDDIPLAADKSLGVNVDLGDYDAAGREAALAEIEVGGLRWIRQRFAWDALEPARGQYDWTLADEIVDAVGRHNLGMIAVLDGSPRWARAEVDADNALAPPTETADWGRFVSAFATRYGGRIDYYQVWDEPNIAPHWGAREIDPAAYARLLREGAIQIRTADPGATILLAALAPNVEGGGANLSELAFLEELYGSGAGEWFDVVAVQPYGFEQGPAAAPRAGELNWRRAVLVRRVMEAYGDRGTAVWATSFGWPAGRAGEIAGAVDIARQDWPWLGPMLWAAWSPADTHGEYALVDDAGQPGPAWAAVHTLAQRPAVAWPGVYPAEHASGRYTGGWRLASRGADIGGSGDQLAVQFWGSRFDLRVRRGDYRAFLFATVDGKPANALPRDTAGNSYVVLYDPLSQEEWVTLAHDLEPGPHTAEIVAERGWGQWAIGGWAASRQRSVPSPVLPVAAALCAIAAGAWAWRGLPRALAGAAALVGRYRALDGRLALVVSVVAVAVVIAAPGTVLSLPALGLLGVALVLRPDTGLPLIAVALPFYQPGKPLAGKVFSLVEILVVLTALAWAADRLLGRVVRGWPANPASRAPGQSQAKRGLAALAAGLSSLDWAVVALTAWGAVSLLWADHAREAAREYRTVVLEAALFYGLLRSMARDRQAAWRVVDAWLLGAAAVALLGIGQWALGENVITADGVWRVRGFYGSPNNLALYLGRALPAALSVAVLARREAGQARRWLYGLAAALAAAALFLTYSRGAWLVGVPAALLFLVLAGLRRRRALLVAMALVALIAVVVVAAGSGRLASLLDTSQGTTFFRLQLWRSSLAMAADHPLLGVGLDNFLYSYRTRYVLPTAWEEFNLSHPHNLVLDFWLRLGLPGLALLAWLLVAYFRQAWRAYRRLEPATAAWALAVGLTAGMVNFVAHGLVDAAFFLVDLAFVFMLMAAIIQVLSASAGERPVDNAAIQTRGG